MAFFQYSTELLRCKGDAPEGAKPKAHGRAGARLHIPAHGRAQNAKGRMQMQQGWFEQIRKEQFPTTEAAARACGVGTKLMWHLECGSVTVPELARRIGRVMGLTRAQVSELTSQKTVARRREEAAALQNGENGGAYPAGRQRE
jgi:hypothetical protein